MNVVKWAQYGPSEVLRVGVIDTPSPKEDELLVRVRRRASLMSGPCTARIFEEREPQTTRSREG
jgi:hypothetical protein